MLSIGTESVILSLSCAGFLRYPGVDMVTLSTVWNARRRCRFGGSYPRSARALLQDIWISTDVAMSGETRHAPQSKTILRIMKKYGLWAEIRRRRQWVQVGQQLHKYENLLKRPFQADWPNSKWVTDISYIHTKEGVLYLSTIRDLYDNSIVAYKIGTQQTVNLVLDTIRLAMMKEKKRVAATL